MSEPQTPPSGPTAPPAGAPPPGDPAKGLTEEVSLEDLDKLLDEEDPEFAKALSELRMIETDTTVDIESSVDPDDNPNALVPEPIVEPLDNLKGVQKYKAIIRLRLVELKQSLKAQAAQAASDCWQSMKTWPKHTWTFTTATASATHRQIMVPVTAVGRFSRNQKFLLVGASAFALVCLVLLVANLRGIWLPYLNEPILGSFEEIADHAYAYDTKSDISVFYAAFPKEPHEFLLGKFKVNLKRTPEHPNPMGAFEIIVSVDSKDTAIELSSREVEFNDLAQRVLEDEEFETLDTEIGKMRFKSRLKQVISGKLTQGWVKEINFKTMVLKP